MKQTAVEWLDNELREYFFHGNGTLETILKQAKEMEMKQIMDAYDSGWSDGSNDKDLNAEYYNETFNTNEK